MSARKSTVAVTAVCAWVGAVSLAIAHADIDKVFALLVAAAALLTLSLMKDKSLSSSNSNENPEDAAKAETPDYPEVTISTLVLVKVHETGWQQGWQAKELALSMAGGRSRDIPQSSPSQN